MTRPNHRIPVVLLSVLAMTALIAGILITATAAPARAHTDLVGSTPRDGAHLQRPPADIDLTFSEEVRPGFASISVRVKGRTIPTTVSQGQDARTIRARFADAEPRPAGSWQVAYRVTSTDGHPINGTLAFQADRPAKKTKTGSTTAEPVERPKPQSANQRADSSADGSNIWSTIIVGGLAAGGAGAVGVLLARMRRRAGNQ